jgi:hypothetical protein
MKSNGGVSWSPILRKGNFHHAPRFGRVTWSAGGAAPSPSASASAASLGSAAPTDSAAAMKPIQKLLPIRPNVLRP